MLSVGQTASLTGYVTVTAAVLGRTTQELEGILGYNPGALRDGYWFARLTDTIRAGEFEFRGYTQFSGGVPKGATETTHDSLRRSLSSHPTDQQTWKRLVAEAVERLGRGGVDRVAKVIPKSRPDAYPPGKGVVQYEILRTSPKSFLVEAEVGPGFMLIRRPDDTVHVVAARP